MGVKADSWPCRGPCSRGRRGARAGGQALDDTGLAGDVPDGLPIPRWSWDGIVSG